MTTAEPEPVEISIEDLIEKIGSNEEDRKKVRSVINQFERNDDGFRVRQLETEVQLQKGVNRQQHSTIAGVFKWMGNQNRMTYNVVKNLAISQGGIKGLLNDMKEKSFIEKNPAIVGVLIFFAFYASFIYSPAVRTGVQSIFASPAQEALLIGVVIIGGFVWVRNRRQSA